MHDIVHYLIKLNLMWNAVCSDFQSKENMGSTWYKLVLPNMIGIGPPAYQAFIPPATWESSLAEEAGNCSSHNGTVDFIVSSCCHAVYFRTQLHIIDWCWQQCWHVVTARTWASFISNYRCRNGKHSTRLSFVVEVWCHWYVAPFQMRKKEIESRILVDWIKFLTNLFLNWGI